MSETAVANTASNRLPDTFLNKARRVLTGACLFILTFLIVHITYTLVTSILLKILGYDPKPHFNGIANLPPDWRKWSTSRVLVIFSAGPVWVLFLGISLLRIYNKRQEKGLVKLLTLWLIINSIVYFLFIVIISPLGVENYNSGFYKGPAVIATWMRISPIIMTFFALVCVAAAILYGYYTCYEFLKYSYSSKYIQKVEGKNSITMQLFLFPAIVGGCVILAFSNFNTFFSFLTYIACMVAVSVGMFIKNSNDITTVKCLKSDVLNRIPVFYLSAVAVVLVLIKLFYMKMK